MSPTTILLYLFMWIEFYATSDVPKPQASIAVVTSDKTQTRLRLFRDSPRNLVERLNSKFQATASEALANASSTSNQWVAITFDVRRREYYVLDRKTSNIVIITDASGSNINKTRIVLEGVDLSRSVTKLAYDWLRRSLYWADPSYQTIFRLDISHICLNRSCSDPDNIKETWRKQSPRRGIVTALIAHGLVQPCSVVVDPIRRFLYWADDDTEDIPNIQMSTLDGANRTRLVDGLIRPTGLTLDFNKNLLYWLERLSGTSVINRCHVDSFPCVPIRVSTVYESRLYDLDYHQDILITSDLLANRLIFVDIRTDQILRQNWAGAPYGVCVATEDRQPLQENFKADPFVSDPESSFINMSIKGVIFLASETHGILVAPKTFALGYADFLSVLIVEEQGITTMAIDVRRQRLFYFSKSTKSIFKVALPDSLFDSSVIKKTEIVSAWVENVSGLAVDWLTGNLYWSDSHYRRIMVARDNGHFPSVLHHSNLVQPENLVIISPLRYMFWTDGYYDDYRIERSDLDGRNRIILVGSTLLKRKPEKLVVDARRNILYWASENDICCYSFHTDVSEKCFTVVDSIKSLDVMHDYLIWADMNGGLRVAHFNTEVATEHSLSPKLYQGMNFSDVSYYHISKHVEEEDPCSTISVSSKQERKRFRKRHSQKCSQLCLPSGKSSRCVCTTGYWLKSNGDCWEGIVVDYFWLFCDLQTGQIFGQFSLLPDYYLFVTPGKFHIVDVTLDNIQKRLYWVDEKSNMVYSQFLNGTQQRVNFIGNENFNVTKVKVAPQSRLLYITSTNGDVILLSLQTGYFRLILQLTTWAIRHIDVDEHNMLIYMTAVSKTITEENNIKPGAVLCSHMDGTNLHNVYVYDGSPLGIHVHNGNVFWVDPMKQFILNGKVRGTGVQVQPIVHLTGDAYPENIFVKGDEVYFTDRSKQSLQRFTLNNSAVISNAGFPYMNRISGLNYFDSSKVNEPFQQTLCDEIWVPKPDNNSICMCRTENNNLTDANKQCFDVINQLQKVASYFGICMVQPLVNGTVKGADVGSYVPSGGTVTVSCDPGFVIGEKRRKNETRKCYQGQWTSADQCVAAMSYKIHGNSSRGYVIFKDSTTFLVPHGVFHIDVVCIGGGGGGFDACDKTSSRNESQAGCGGLSSFGKYLRAHGGLGGKMNEGGRGGMGKTLFGGDGLVSHDCQGGGAAGQTEPPDNCMLGQTACLFCGAGGAMTQCSNCFSRGGGCGGFWSIKGEEGAADDYGGGATGLFGGGSGGGGGYSRGLLRVSPQQPIHVKVGKGGTPSAKPAGNGIVVVEWGSRLEKLVYSVEKKSTEPCKPIIFKPFDKEAILKCNSAKFNDQ